MSDLTWIDRAACRDADPDLFHPIKADDDGAGLALHICRRHCPVRLECLAWYEGKLHAGTVAGGEHWVASLTDNAYGAVQPRGTPERAKSCTVCRSAS